MNNGPILHGQKKQRKVQLITLYSVLYMGHMQIEHTKIRPESLPFDRKYYLNLNKIPPSNPIIGNRLVQLLRIVKSIF